MGVYIKGMTKEDLLKTLPVLESVVVEVPEPHGRLIDADVLCERLMAMWLTADENGKKIIPEVTADVVTPIVVGTPTVIEAEGE